MTTRLMNGMKTAAGIAIIAMTWTMMLPFAWVGDRRERRRDRRNLTAMALASARRRTGQPYGSRTP